MFFPLTDHEKNILGNFQHMIFERRANTTNYANTVNVKPWGYEYLIYQNNRVAIWLMHIGKNQRTSLHCHFQKDTLVINLNGVAVVNMIDEEDIYLPLMDTIFLQRGKFHGFSSLHDETMLLEIEMFGNNLSFSDKNDLLRLKDVYQRDSTGYEGSIISLTDATSLAKYNVFMLSETVKKHVIDDKITLSLDNDVISSDGYCILVKGTARDRCGRMLKEGSIVCTKDITPVSLSGVEVLNIGRTNIAEDGKIVYDVGQLKYVVEALKREDKKIVMTSGCFDIMHTGHIHHLRRAKSLGDMLMVCVSNDEQITKLKGLGRPVNKYQDRIDLLKVIPYIDYVILYHEVDISKEETLDQIMQIVQPDVWTKGNDYTQAQIQNKHPNLTHIEIIPNIHDKSTTNIIYKAKAI